MAENGNRFTTLALATKVEEGFISPLTTIRGSLEILRDFPDLETDKRANFVTVALRECAVLEKSIDDLAASVYAAAERDPSIEGAADITASDVGTTGVHFERVLVAEDSETIEVDLSGLTFPDSDAVTMFFDQVTDIVRKTGRKWYLLVDITDLSVWPEAWVAFAHRSKKLSTVHGLVTFRVDRTLSASSRDQNDGDFADLASARAQIATMRDN